MSVPTTPISFPEQLPRQYLLLDGVSWDYYERTLEVVRQRHLRITYDRGRMEFMSPGIWHDRAKKAIARLLEMYASERNIPITGLGSVTCKHEDLERGIEPDECYYIATDPPPMDEKKALDLSLYAPPDLAIEVDVTHSSIPREPIYGAFGVPEVWRFDGQRVTALHRQQDGKCRAADSSLSFPELPMEAFNRFLTMALSSSTDPRLAQHTAVHAIRDWARSGHA